MRVLLIHQAFISGHEAGGTRHFEFGQHLAQNGDSLVVVASQVNYLTNVRVSPERKGLYYREDQAGVEVLRAYTLASVHRNFVMRVLSFLIFALTSTWTALRAGPVDLVMGTSPPIFQAFSAWLVAKLRGKRFLLEIRDLWPEFAIDIGVLRNPILIKLARWGEGFLYQQADHLLVNSPAYRDYLITKSIPAEKITLVSNGVDPRMFHPESRGSAFREGLGLLDKFLAIYAGALGMANDLSTILQAAEQLKHEPQIHFVLVGGGRDRKQLEQEAQDRGLNNVTFAGAVPKDQMPDVLAAADVCLATLKNIPMFTTTYPNKVFDYMAAGRPTILAIDGVIRKVIEDSGGGVFTPPGDAKALASAVESLYHDPQRRQQMGKSARQFVSQHFNREKQAMQFRELLYQLTQPRLNETNAETGR